MQSLDSEEPASPEFIIHTSSNEPQLLRNFWYFCQLLNQIISKSGSNAFFEIIEDGFISFCSSLSDLEQIFAPVHDRKQFIDLCEQLQDSLDQQPFIWRYTFVRPRDLSRIESAAAIINQYWMNFNCTITRFEIDGIPEYELTIC